MDDDVIEKMAKFWLFGNVLRPGGVVQEAVTTKIKSGWKKSNNVASALCKSVVVMKLTVSSKHKKEK